MKKLAARLHLRTVIGLFLTTHLLGCTSGDQAFAIDKNPPSLTLTQWSTDLHHQNFQQQLQHQIKQGAVRFQNDSQLLDFSPRAFVVLAENYQACQEWAQWAESDAFSWTIQIHAGDSPQSRCPQEGLATLYFHQPFDALSLSLQTTAALPTAQKPHSFPHSSSPASDPSEDGPSKDGAAHTSAHAVHANSLVSLAPAYSKIAPLPPEPILVETRRDACPNGFFGSIVLERRRADASADFGEWRTIYQGCAPGCGVPDESYKEIEDRWVTESRPCALGTGVEIWGRTETRERFSQCLQPESNPPTDPHALVDGALSQGPESNAGLEIEGQPRGHSDNHAFGRIWGPWIPTSEWERTDTTCDSPVCQAPPSVTEIRRDSCPPGLVGFVDHERQIQWECVSNTLMARPTPWQISQSHCSPCVVNKRLSEQWIQESCQQTIAIQRKWTQELTCFQEDRTTQGQWKPTAETRTITVDECSTPTVDLEE